MRNCIKYFVVACIAISFGCSSDDSGGDNNPGGGLVAQATYKITFEPSFSEDDYPIDYPANPSFTKMFVMAHSSSSSLFNIGSAASDGLKKYVTEGDVSLLQSEHTTDEGASNATKIEIGNDINATGSSDSVTIVVNPDLLEISFVSKLSPSPDWFVGVSSFSIANPDNSLVEFMSIPLYPMDGGADAGTSYESPDEPETGPVTIINGDPFTPPSGGNLSKSIGSLIIERIN